MKTVLLQTSFFFSLTLAAPFAQASFYQEYCGDSRGQIQMANGHMDNYLKVNKQDKEDYQIIKETELFSDTSSTCSAGVDFGMTQWKTRRLIEIEVDSKRYVLVCELEGNSELFCKK